MVGINFKHIVLLVNVEQNWAQQIEKYLIRQYKSNNPDYGYNISLGGDLGNYGRPCSDEAKKMISEKNSGRIVSQETRNKISKSLKGKAHTALHNQRVSNALKGKYVGELSPSYGIKRTDETRKKMSEAAKLGWIKRRARLDADKRTDI